MRMECVQKLWILLFFTSYIAGILNAEHIVTSVMLDIGKELSTISEYEMCRTCQISVAGFQNLQKRPSIKFNEMSSREPNMSSTAHWLFVITAPIFNNNTQRPFQSKWLLTNLPVTAIL